MERDLLIWIQYMDTDISFLTAEMCENKNQKQKSMRTVIKL